MYPPWAFGPIMLTLAPRCGVCGWRGEDDVCPQCGTVLLKGLALCHLCGKAFDGPLARCDACGGDVEPPRTAATSDAVERLSRLPGVGPDSARRLVARGFGDPADVLRLALPERAVRLGMHRTLARRLTLENLPSAPHVRKTMLCATCGLPREGGGQCPACGSRGERGIPANEVERTLGQVSGLVYDLSADPDFQGMPERLREEILEAFEEAGLATADGEYAEQFREWKARGFETRELERILRDQGPDEFRARFVAIIRCQIMKRRSGDEFACPICDVELLPTVEECENCGAKFQ